MVAVLGEDVSFSLVGYIVISTFPLPFEGEILSQSGLPETLQLTFDATFTVCLKSIPLLLSKAPVNVISALSVPLTVIVDDAPFCMTFTVYDRVEDAVAVTTTVAFLVSVEVFSLAERATLFPFL